MAFKKIAFLFCLLWPVIICSCTIEDYSLEYTFDNKSSFTIQVTLLDPYKTNTEEEEERTSPFWVYSMDVTKVYVQNNGIVDFRWTTSYAGDNPKVYCVTKGPEATFKNR